MVTKGFKGDIGGPIMGGCIAFDIINKIKVKLKNLPTPPPPPTKTDNLFSKGGGNIFT